MDVDVLEMVLKEYEAKITKIVYFPKAPQLRVFLELNRPLSEWDRDKVERAWQDRFGIPSVAMPTVAAKPLFNGEALFEKLKAQIPLASTLTPEDFTESGQTLTVSVRNEALACVLEQSEVWRDAVAQWREQGRTLALKRAERTEALRPADFHEAPIVVKRPQVKEKSVKSPAAVISGDGFSFGRFTRKADDQPLTPLAQISMDMGLCRIRGELHAVNYRKTKSDKILFQCDLTDEEGGAVLCKMFLPGKDEEAIQEHLRDGVSIIAQGRLQFDTYAKANVFTFTALAEAKKKDETDSAEEKRIELAVHTQMTAMEGLINPKALAKQLKAWGHSAVAITDKGSVQAYPLAFDAFHGTGIRLILGYHAKMLSEEHKILTNLYRKDPADFHNAYTVFDIETTGFSRFNDRIIEIGAVRYENGVPTDIYDEFVNPGRLLPEKITELTGITDSMVSPADPIDKVLPRFLEFARDSILVAHNADFDIGFIVENAHRLELDFEPIYLDTLGLARALHPEYKNHKLDTLTKKLNVALINHHRASDDAKATGEVFLKLMAEWEKRGEKLSEINNTASEFPLSRHESAELLLYCQKQSALKGFYDLISQANMRYYFRSAGLPEKLLRQNREGLVVATGFVGSKLFEAVSRRWPKARLLELLDEADCVMVEPSCFWEKAERDELVADEDHYRSIVESILRLGEERGKPCMAIGSPYYLKSGERIARNILVNYQRKVEMERVPRYRFLNTKEMLAQFAWLGTRRAEELVIYEPRRFAERMEDVRPIPDGTFTPQLPGAEEELREMTMARATAIYGDPLPELVHARLERELTSIITHGYASLYVIAQKLVAKSNEDGYLVGSRGSVGSSFAATMAGITEVNPLVPHYICRHCRHSEFIEDGSVGSGFDLPAKKCPICGAEMERNGHDIPFEVFLGFHGDKEPDIDLNFAGEYMSVIHKYTETLFGAGKVFRAGTIGGIQEKTAYGLIRKYLEQEFVPEEERLLSEAQIRMIQRMMDGTKRTTGQHAGGLMIVPQTMDILDFCPIQYPADDLASDVITTHFSYKNLSGRMLKLDELGHTSPTIIRQLEELTGIDPLTIEFGDPETMAIFSGAESLCARAHYKNEDDGSLGIPELGTGFVRGMLKETKPSTFAELVRISGLSHGTDVWVGNARDLIHDGVTDLSHAICTRDDIMIYLISKGMDQLESFKTMEAVRKGKGIPNGTEEHMREHGVPEWYIESCNKIKYMFPKAHAVAYVMMSYRIAWFKVHSPAAFYATYYGQRLSDFSTLFLFHSLDEVQEYQRSTEKTDDAAEGNEEIDNAKRTLLEVIEEMYARGFSFAPVSLYDSAATEFLIRDEHTVLPPLAALDEVSEAMACSIVRARNDGEFLSVEEFKKRTGVSKNAMNSMQEYGLLDSLPMSNQMSFFSGF